MDTYGVKSAIDQFNQGRQYVAEQNALINQNNIKRKEDKDAKIEQDSLIGDFNYAKDAVSNFYQGSGVKDAYTSYQGRVKKEALKAKQALDRAKVVGDTGQTTSAPAPTPAPTQTEPDDRPPFVSDRPPAQRQSFSMTIGNREVQPQSNLRRSFAVGERLDANQVFSQALDRDDQPAPATAQPPQGRTRQQLIDAGGDAPVMSATLDNDDAPTRLSTAPEGSAPEGEESSLTTKIIKGATGVGDETAETIGRVGGALAGASMAGISLYDDIDNKIKTGKFFGKDDSGADDFSNVTNIIAGASDVVGLVPGLEWVAGLGNAVGGVGGIVKMFGDHAKNVAQAQQDKDSDKPTPTISVNPSQTTGVIEQTAQSNIRQPTTTSQVY